MINVKSAKESCPVSVLIPTYNGELTIHATLTSLFKQTFKDFEVIVSDDSSTDRTLKIVRDYFGESVRVVHNRGLKGYSHNLQHAFKNSSGETVYLLGQDDILHPNAIELALNAYHAYGVGAVTRPYYWFKESPNNVVRVKFPLNGSTPKVVRASSGAKQLAKLFSSADQLSGLLIGREHVLAFPFHQDIFPCHAYPFAAATLSQGAVYLSEYTVAVRTESSQSRNVSDIYDLSPTKSWIDWGNSIFGFFGISKLGKRVVSELVNSQWLGLLQIAASSRKPRVFVIREFRYMVKARSRTIVDLKVLALCVMCLFLPKALLIQIREQMKTRVIGPIRKSGINQQFIEYAVSICGLSERETEVRE